MQSDMEKSSSLSALRQRVRDGVAESDFAGLARLVTHRGVWQAVAADPISCAYMAPVWAYGLAPAPGVDIFGRLERWCPALPAADYALGILYADGLCLPRNVHLARYHLILSAPTSSTLTPYCLWRISNKIHPARIP